MERAQRILVRVPNWLGDAVMATPGLRALRAGHPDAHIALHLRPEFEPLLAGSPWVDEILPLESYHRGGAALLREARALRRQPRFDLGLCLTDSVSSALLMRAAGVRCVVGFRRGPRAPLLHRALEVPAAWGPRRLVARERYVLELVESVGGREAGTELQLAVRAEDEMRAERALEERGVSESAPLAAIAPGASYGSAKLWPVARFARVGDALAEAGASVAIVGAAGEAALSASVARAMRQPAADLAGALDLGALKALLRRARVLVCNDAGARHVAVALGTPVVMMIGPTDLARTGLNLAAVSVFESAVECRPCYRRVCPIDHRCMTRIDAGEVALTARRAAGLAPSADRQLSPGGALAPGAVRA